MTSFEVAPDELDRCAELVSRLGNDTRFLRGFIQTSTGLTPLTGAGQAVYPVLVALHTLVRTDFLRRTEMLWECLRDSRTELRDAAEWYRGTDTANAAELDAAYPTASRDRLTTEDGADLPLIVANFGDVADPGAPLNAPLDVAKAAPKTHFIESTARGIADNVSPAYWIRKVLNELLGYDPIEYTVEAYAGKWEDWGRSALAWKACAESADAMSRNLGGVDEGLAQTWSGNAADGAMSYFQRLANATNIESVAFGAAHEVYMAITDVVFQSVETANDLVNGLIDTLLLAPIEEIAQLPKIAKKVYAIVSEILDVLGRTLQSVNATETAAAASGQLPTVPPTQLQALVNGYDHPSPEV